MEGGGRRKEGGENGGKDGKGGGREKLMKELKKNEGGRIEEIAKEGMEGGEIMERGWKGEWPTSVALNCKERNGRGKNQLKSNHSI